AFELEPLAQHVEALAGELHQAVRPRQAAEGNARAVEVPAVQDVVIGRDDDGEPGVGVVVKINERSGGNVGFVLGGRLARAVKAAVGKDALQRHGAGYYSSSPAGGGALLCVPERLVNSIPTITPSGSSCIHTMRPWREVPSSVPTSISNSWPSSTFSSR